MTPRRLIPLLAGLLLFTALDATALAREDRDDLSQAFAEFRRAQVAEAAYEMQFTFREKAKTFDGRTTIHVTLNRTDAPLSIDLRAESLDAVYVDGARIPDIIRRNGSFDIPSRHLRAGPMAISVAYTAAYSNSRDGLCHFTDPLDGREYFYTNLEPYAAHYVFPCFDQPDIKATYTMTAEAPAAWTIIGNMPEESASETDGARITRFKTTPLLSTYLFFVGGGQYRVWRAEHNGLPMAMYARASLAPFFDAERLFDETRAGLDYFNDYFGTPYPFEKYDHVFAPELGPGAMENPGAVTMNEFMIYRGAATEEDYRSRNNILLHEMAHMWFGNLVTMAWWNDLWLNESFATFSAYQAQEAIGAYGDIWARFHQSKGWAYYQDQLSTTHPVEVDVPWAQEAIANFDGITYAKGAAALKQLWFTAGADAYREGVSEYFRRYAWKNATRAQFIASVAEAAETSLDTWTERWIRTEGLSNISVTYGCDGGAITSFEIHQTPYNAPQPSPHRTQIALFAFDEAGALKPYHTAPASYDGARTSVPELDGKPCPDFVFPNYGDMDYGLFFLDAKSLDTAREHLQAIDDPFVRRMVWGTLSHMVQHQRLRASELMDLLLQYIPKETHPDLRAYLLGNHPTRDVFRAYLPLDARLEYAPRLSGMLWTGYENAAPDSDARLHWLDAFVATASRWEDTERLRSLLNASRGVDQPRRWSVVKSLAALGEKDAEALIAAELSSDPGDQGQRQAFAARGAIPTLAAKRAQWERLIDPELSLSLQRAGAGTFYNNLHPGLAEAFEDAWFQYVLGRDWEEEQHRISIWFGTLHPPIYTRAFLERSRAALENAALPARARRAWQESNDGIARMVAIREHEAAAQTP